MPLGLPPYLFTRPGTLDKPHSFLTGFEDCLSMLTEAQGLSPDHGQQAAKCSRALRRWPSGSLYFSEGTNKGQCQREKAAGTEVRFQDEGLRAGKGWDWQTGGVNSRNPAVGWVPPTAALWTGSASKTHILNTCFPAHADLGGVGPRQRKWITENDPGPASAVCSHL